MATATIAAPPPTGLTEAEAARRLAARGPHRQPATSRSYASIVRANVFTIFNLILAVAGAVTIAFGEWQDALFLGILVFNTAIGIVQEVRAKRALDKLAALVAPTATVVRDNAARVGERRQRRRRRRAPCPGRRPDRRRRPRRDGVRSHDRRVDPDRGVAARRARARRGGALGLVRGRGDRRVRGHGRRRARATRRRSPARRARSGIRAPRSSARSTTCCSSSSP